MSEGVCVCVSIAVYIHFLRRARCPLLSSHLPPSLSLFLLSRRVVSRVATGGESGLWLWGRANLAASLSSPSDFPHFGFELFFL